MVASRNASSVLVVDDDDAIRETVRDLLEEEGYDVLVAKNGREALDLLEKAVRCPGLVLLDLMMPVMTGWEVLEELQQREQYAGIPVVIVSAMCAPGAAAFLPKPVKLGRLLEVVAQYCGCAGAA
jgi:CheY-like chemotaxis protein